MAYDWESAYNAALDETDESKMHERVLAAEDALLGRVQELHSSNGEGDAEREAINRAFDGLLKFKTDIMKWPA